MNGMPLGKRTAVPDAYDPCVLYPIPRDASGDGVHGFDLWRCYELSWLGPSGRPEAAMLEIAYPVESRSMIESKSLKLYLGSFSNTAFAGGEEVVATIRADLGRVLQTPWVEVSLLPLSHVWEGELPGSCIDGLEVEIIPGDIDPGFLSVEEGEVEEALFSHLLKTSCPITLQPDWASVLVEYRGGRISPASLLRYLCSYRSHSGFGEECCTRIFQDISRRCKPVELKVSLFYTRRGGIDINPVRCSRRADVDEVRKYRLPRQ